MELQQHMPVHQLGHDQARFALDAGFMQPMQMAAAFPKRPSRGTSMAQVALPTPRNQSQSLDSPGAFEDAYLEPYQVQELQSPSSLEDVIQLESSAQQTPGKEGEAQKRPRACEACRGLKVRCDFPPEAERCKRCAKAKRQCIVTVPSRKRQRKTDTKVADLERRIDDLTATLEEQKRQMLIGGAGNRRVDSLDDDDSENFSLRDFTGGHGSGMAWKKRKSSFIGDISTTSLVNGFPPNLPGPMPSADMIRNNSEYADVVDRGVLRAEDAAMIFEHFTVNMEKHLPAVIFPQKTTAGYIRKTKPVLFLAILSVASGQNFPDKQRLLTREVLRTLADRVLCRAEKSLELVQAMQVMSIWHVSEDPRDSTTFQLIQLASSMAISMEINGAQLRSGLGVSLVNDKQAHPSPSAQDFEQRRAWLACFLLSGIISLPMKQLNMIRWSSHLEDSVNLLRTSPNAESSDATLCKWVDIQRISDRVAELSLSLVSPEGNKKAVRHELQTILNRVTSLRKEIDSKTDLSLSLQLYEAEFHARIIIMKAEDELHAPHPTRRPKTAASKLSDVQAEAIRQCVASIHQLLDVFAGCLEHGSSLELNSLPSFHFSRVAYGLVSLIVLHFGATAPDSRIAGAVHDPTADLRVAAHLARLLEALRASAPDETRRPVQKFQLLVKMLRAWFERPRRASLSATGPHLLQPHLGGHHQASGSVSPATVAATGTAAATPLQPRPAEAAGRSTPRMGYRKLNLQSDAALDAEATEDGASLPRAARLAVPLAGQYAAGASPVTSRPNSGHHEAGLQHSSTWPGPQHSTASHEDYEPPQQAMVGGPTGWFATPYGMTSQQQSLPGPPGGGYGGAGGGFSLEGIDPTSWNTAGLTIDPAIEQAMGMALGPEGHMFGSLVDDFFGTVSGPSGVEPGHENSYQSWFSGPGV